MTSDCTCRRGYSYGGPLSITNGPITVRDLGCSVDNHAELAQARIDYNSVDPDRRRAACSVLGLDPSLIGLGDPK